MFDIKKSTMDLGGRYDNVGAVGVQAKFIDPVVERKPGDIVAHPDNFGQRCGGVISRRGTRASIGRDGLQLRFAALLPRT